MFRDNFLPFSPAIPPHCMRTRWRDQKCGSTWSKQYVAQTLKRLFETAAVYEGSMPRVQMFARLCGTSARHSYDPRVGRIVLQLLAWIMQEADCALQVSMAPRR